MGYNCQKRKMGIKIVQTIDDGDSITIIGEGEVTGNRYTATEPYGPDYHTSKAEATERATRRVLDN